MQGAAFPVPNHFLQSFQTHDPTVLQRPPLHRARPQGQTQPLGWPRGTPHPAVPRWRLSGPDRAWRSIPGPGRPVGWGVPAAQGRAEKCQWAPKSSK